MFSLKVSFRWPSEDYHFGKEIIILAKDRVIIYWRCSMTANGPCSTMAQSTADLAGLCAVKHTISFINFYSCDIFSFWFSGHIIKFKLDSNELRNSRFSVDWKKIHTYILVIISFFAVRFLHKKLILIFCHLIWDVWGNFVKALLL